MKKPFTGKVVLITGAASGIGRETAFAFAEGGATLELIDIDQAGLERTGVLCEGLGAQVYTQLADVSSADAMAEVAARVHERAPAVDVLMNNAGVGVVGSFVGTELATWDWALGVNVKGVVHGCHFFVPNMIARGCGGQVVNVSSAAGYAASTLMPVYVATKFAVRGLSDALRGELKKHKIQVTTVCPGLIDTPITRNMRTTGDLARRPEFHDRAAALYRRRNYTPDRVASAIYRAVQKGKGGILPVSPEAWLLYYGTRFAPRITAAAMSLNPL